MRSGLQRVSLNKHIELWQEVRVEAEETIDMCVDALERETSGVVGHQDTKKLQVVLRLGGELRL